MSQAIYVMRGSDMTKVGISNSPKFRRTALAPESPGLALVYSAYPGDKNAPKLERRAHELLSAHRIRGEWFNVGEKDAIDAIAKAAAELGMDLVPHKDRRIPILMRTDDALKAALEKLAADQDRSVSYILEKILIAHLREIGYLPTPKKRPRS